MARRPVSSTRVSLCRCLEPISVLPLRRPSDPEVVRGPLLFWGFQKIWGP